MVQWLSAILTVVEPSLESERAECGRLLYVETLSLPHQTTTYGFFTKSGRGQVNKLVVYLDGTRIRSGIKQYGPRLYPILFGT